MQTLYIGAEEAGRKLDRYLMRQFPKAPKSFLYKALRTNKIKVNGRKPLDLNYILREKDALSIYFTEEQWENFSEKKTEPQLIKDFKRVPILYEDENLLVLNKPAGMLSQKDHTGEVSLNEVGLQMLWEEGMKFSSGFTPGVCHRLDRNTAGAVIMAKNLRTAQGIHQMIADKKLEKFYTAVVEGNVPWKVKKLIGYWKKDKKLNYVEISEQNIPNSKEVECICRIIERNEKYSLMEIQLLTGKSHQIRAQLAAAGYPLAGDAKYGTVGGKGQFLCASRIVFSSCPEPLKYLEGTQITAPLPKSMERFIKNNVLFCGVKKH